MLSMPVADRAAIASALLLLSSLAVEDCSAASISVTSRYTHNTVHVHIHGSGLGGCDFDIGPGETNTGDCSCVWGTLNYVVEVTSPADAKQLCTSGDLGSIGDCYGGPYTVIIAPSPYGNVTDPDLPCEVMIPSQSQQGNNATTKNNTNANSFSSGNNHLRSEANSLRPKPQRQLHRPQRSNSISTSSVSTTSTVPSPSPSAPPSPFLWSFSGVPLDNGIFIGDTYGSDTYIMLYDNILEEACNLYAVHSQTGEVAWNVTVSLEPGDELSCAQGALTRDHRKAILVVQNRHGGNPSVVAVSTFAQDYDPLFWVWQGPAYYQPVEWISGPAGELQDQWAPITIYDNVANTVSVRLGSEVETPGELIIGIDADSGQQSWENPVNNVFYGKGYPFEIQSGMPNVYFGPMAVDANEGSVLWNSDASFQHQWAMPIVVKGPYCGLYMVSSNDNTLHAYSQYNGTEIWSTNVEGFSVFSGIPDEFSDRFYSGFDTGKVSALNLSTGSLLWTTLVSNYTVTLARMNFVGPVVYAVATDALIALDTTTGNVTGKIVADKNLRFDPQVPMEVFGDGATDTYLLASVGGEGGEQTTVVALDVRSLV